MLSFLLYLPVLGHFFVSDDFKVLNRVCNNGIIFIPGFFRPLSDLTIYANFLVGGLHPLVYNSFNILVHALNGFLLFILCLSAPFGVPENRKLLFAFSVSVLFLSYPFHNEGVVWLLGRGASMACFFSLGALLIYHKIGNRPLKIFCVCICYFIGLSAFESILFFPLIFFICATVCPRKLSTVRVALEKCREAWKVVPVVNGFGETESDSSAGYSFTPIMTPRTCAESSAIERRES